MGGSAGQPRSTWFTDHSGLALFCAGLAMVAAAVFSPSQPTATMTVLVLIGAALILTGALLPRLSGTIKITPGSIELAVAQRLEATRREATRRDPEHVEEAVGRAFETLREHLYQESLTADPIPLAVPPAPMAGPAPREARVAPAPTAASCQPAAPSVRPRRRVGLSLAAAGLAAVALLAVSTPVLLLPAEDAAPAPAAPAEDPAPAPAEDPAPAPAARWPLALAAVGVLVLAAAGSQLLRARRSQDDAQSALSEPPTVFASKIVDQLAHQGEDEGGPVSR